METLEQTLMRRISSDQWADVRNHLCQLPPIWKMKNNIQIVTGYKQACDLLANKKISSEYISKLSNENLKFSNIDRINNIIRASFALQDGSKHLYLRELITPIFLPTNFQKIFARVEGDATDLIQQALNHDHTFDLVESLARRLPILVNCQILGLSYSHESRLRAMIDALVAEIEFDHEKRNEFALFDLLEFIETFKTNPLPEWLQPLVNALHENEISDLDFEATILLLLISGYGTATSGIGTSVAALFSQEGSFNALRNDEYPTEGFIYEALRLCPPVSILSRYAKEDIEIDGTHIQKNELILIQVAAACRDPNVFGDPHIFNPTRSNKAQLIFGGGAHFCLGRLLGLRQIEASINALLRLPLSMKVSSDEIAFHPFKIMQGPLSLPLQFHKSEMLS